MKSIGRTLGAMVLASMFGSLGCGGTDEEQISFGTLHEELNVGSWNELVAMGSTGSFTLTQNINAQGKTWTPKTFSGTFDGGNKTISNLTINGGSFFGSLTNATVRNVKFVNLRITGSSNSPVGGLSSITTNSTIEGVALDVNINVTANAVGGLVGSMRGGSIFRSYAKGRVSGNILAAGGLVGSSTSSPAGMPKISESYALVTVEPNTTNAQQMVTAGGIVGQAYATDIHDVYAVGNVTGRGAVGGIVGDMGCDTDLSYFLLFKTIYRGDVIDKNWTPSGGWAGNVGTFDDCSFRFVQNFYDRSLDGSSHYVPDALAVSGYTSSELRAPTSVIGGVFCAEDIIPERCGDLTWESPPWTAGGNNEHHVLLNVPDESLQPR